MNATSSKCEACRPDESPHKEVLQSPRRPRWTPNRENTKNSKIGSCSWRYVETIIAAVLDAAVWDALVLTFPTFTNVQPQHIILHTIGFELSIDHPYPIFMSQITSLISGRKVEYVTPPSTPVPNVLAKIKGEMMQYSMNFANDSMQTTLCLQFPPQKIATAVVYLSSLFAKVKPTGGKEWLDILDHADYDSMTSIALQILDLLQDRKGAHKETLEKIRAEIQALRDGRASQEPPAKRPRAD